MFHRLLKLPILSSFKSLFFMTQHFLCRCTVKIWDIGHFLTHAGQILWFSPKFIKPFFQVLDKGKAQVVPIHGITSPYSYTALQNVLSVLVCMVQNGPSKSRCVTTPMMMPCPCPSSSRLLKPFFKSHNFFIMEKYIVSEIF